MESHLEGTTALSALPVCFGHMAPPQHLDGIRSWISPYGTESSTEKAFARRLTRSALVSCTYFAEEEPDCES